MRARIKKIAALFLATTLIFCWSGNVSALTEDDSGPSASAMIADTLIARPLGLAVIVVGSVLWVVALPFSGPSGSIDTASRKMVVDPVVFTFQRPLGDF